MSTQQQGRLERFRRNFVDLGSAVLGFSILGHQAFIVKPGEAQWPLIVTGLTLLGVQTGVALMSQTRSASGETGTTGPGSPSPALPPSPPDAPSPPTPSPAPSSGAS